MVITNFQSLKNIGIKIFILFIAFCQWNINLRQDSQNFFWQICKLLVTLGLNILRFSRLKVFLKYLSLKVDVIYKK
jgi:hypothetical protein